MENLASKICDYSEHLTATGYASSAVRAYNSRLRGFLSFVQDQACLDDEQLLSDQALIRESFELYCQYLGSEGVKASSVNSIKSAMKSFCVFLGMPRLNFDRLPALPSQPRSLDTLQSAKLYESIRSESSTRDKAIATIIIMTGMRPSECASLNIREVTFQDGRCFICAGQGAKSRIIAMEEFGSRIVAEHLKTLKSEKDCPLFTSKLGKRISVAGIDLILKNIGRRVRIEVSAQLLRETFITRLVENKMEITAVAAFTGTSLESLRRYYPCQTQVGTPHIVPASEFALTSPMY